MKIKFEINYNASYGQIVHITGGFSALGDFDEEKSFALTYAGDSIWYGTIEVESFTAFQYNYLIKEDGCVVRKEWGQLRSVPFFETEEILLSDCWRNVPKQKALYTSAFSDSLFKQDSVRKPPEYYNNTIILKVNCSYVSKGQEVVLCGESDLLGNWQLSTALRMQMSEYGVWMVAIDVHNVVLPLQYKYAVYDRSQNKVVHWEEGGNRLLFSKIKESAENFVQVYETNYRLDWMMWKGAGIAIPVFSLRSKDSFGVGDFSDLKKMVDWARGTGMKFIQVLPLNDTTNTHTWRDSYPYNAISIYALHPIYLGLSEFPLEDKNKWKAYKKRAKELNASSDLAYEEVLCLKESYLVDLFIETGEQVLKSRGFKSFFKNNEYWLFPYACYTFFRDLYKTANPADWKKFSRYDEAALKKEVRENEEMSRVLNLTYFTQYLLHAQLSNAKQYANANEVVLKGDIPIGISHNSVEAWVEPHLFNLDTQTGAPPDDFSVFGQNWGFPTYNWDEMSRDGYQWWIRRFRKMADYFDAYRIDHILGFFRIWEIPYSSVQGLLGHFSPALPYTCKEIEEWGLRFDESRMAKPYIREEMFNDLFGEYAEEIKSDFLTHIGDVHYALKDFCDTQRKIQTFFNGQTDDKSVRIREGLYNLCNEVLFVRDKEEAPAKYHPRITAQHTQSYAYLSDEEKMAYNKLYDHFFYFRHNEFWADEAMKKLPVLIDSTNMLVCGEDLGMIPDCVPSVMEELQILSLEIQRMPKQLYREFDDLGKIPYLSVCTTSTHDMSPIRVWWKENKKMTQHYYNQILRQDGEAPEECTPELCELILENHLNSSAMLTIIPLQDWLSMNGELRRKDAEEERINIPAVADHYWKYRMHLTIEELLKADEYNKRVKEMIVRAGR